MTDSERLKLDGKNGKYLSIGITEGGIPTSIVGVPWELTAHAFAMHIPDVYFAPEDMNDADIMNILSRFEVIGCYVMTPMRDYGFISNFPKLRDLSIRCGDAITSLDFLRGLDECRMLFLQNARLESLDVILDMKRLSKSIFGCFECVGLYNCEVLDLSRFETERHSFSELLVWRPRGKNERHRWNSVNARTKRYYEYDTENRENE